jgi:hypothetical protein
MSRLIFIVLAIGGLVVAAALASVLSFVGAPLRTRADLEALGEKGSAGLFQSLSSRAFTLVGEFTLSAGAKDFCEIAAPVFPRRLQPPEWMTDGVKIICWDGEADESDVGAIWRICHAEQPSAGYSVAHLEKDFSAGTWEGGLLPEDSGGRCQ